MNMADLVLRQQAYLRCDEGTISEFPFNRPRTCE